MKYVKKKLLELKPYENNPCINDEAVDDVAENRNQYRLDALMETPRDNL